MSQRFRVVQVSSYDREITVEKTRLKIMPKENASRLLLLVFSSAQARTYYYTVTQKNCNWSLGLTYQNLP